MVSRSRVIGGTLLVAGTTIGAAMLVLPVATGLAGFFPSLVLLAVFWVYMTFAAFCMFEVSLCVEGEANIISMARLTLGRWGEMLCWGAYLFLLYALTTAYIAMSAPILDDFVETSLGFNVHDAVAPVPIVLVFGLVVYRGIRSIDTLNRYLMGGLLLCYLLLCYLIAPNVSAERLQHTNWCYAGLGMSIVATAFGYHIIIPSLNQYMGRSVSGMKTVLILGGLAPLLVNVVWEFLSLGVIPIEGAEGLREGYLNGTSSPMLLRWTLKQPLIVHGARFFAFFAICTSVLGVTLSLSDFLADGLGLGRSRRERLGLTGLTFLPPLILVWVNPRASFTALEYAGVIGVVFLLGVMPALMVWGGRYIHGLDVPEYRVPGGKWALGLAILFGAGVILFQLSIQTGLYVCPLLQ